MRIRVYILLVALLAVMGYVSRVSMTKVHAQVAQPYMIEAYLPHTSCMVAVGKTRACFATDGVWVSINGGAYTQLGASASAGVTSWNGLIGAVVYTPPNPPVTSVNGKTGIVVLTSSIQ